MSFVSFMTAVLAVFSMLAVPCEAPRTRTVRGRIVLAEDGRPAVGVRVIALDGGGNYGGVVTGEAISADDGSFTISKLPAERVRLWAFPQMEAYADRFTELTTVEGASDTSGVEVRMHVGSTISGTVEYRGEGSMHCLPLATDVAPSATCPPLHRWSNTADRRHGASAFTIRGIPHGQATIGVMNVCRLHLPASVVRIEKDGRLVEGPFDCSAVRSIEGVHVVVEVRRRS